MSALSWRTMTGQISALRRISLGARRARVIDDPGAAPGTPVGMFAAIDNPGIRAVSRIPVGAEVDVFETRDGSVYALIGGSRTFRIPGRFTRASYNAPDGTVHAGWIPSHRLTSLLSGAGTGQAISALRRVRVPTSPPPAQQLQSATLPSASAPSRRSATCRTAAGCPVYGGPSFAAKVADVSAGARVEVISESPGWVEVHYTNEYLNAVAAGFIPRQWLAIDPPAPVRRLGRVRTGQFSNVQPNASPLGRPRDPLNVLGPMPFVPPILRRELPPFLGTTSSEPPAIGPGVIARCVGPNGCALYPTFALHRNINSGLYAPQGNVRRASFALPAGAEVRVIGGPFPVPDDIQAPIRTVSVNAYIPRVRPGGAVFGVRYTGPAVDVTGREVQLANHSGFIDAAMLTYVTRDPVQPAGT